METAWLIDIILMIAGTILLGLISAAEWREEKRFREGMEGTAEELKRAA